MSVPPSVETPSQAPAPSTPSPSPSPSANSSTRFAPPKLSPKPENPFVYLGIPQWVFDYRPKRPSRNMSIFLSLTVGLTSAYVYDRRECKRIQNEYLDKVRWMSQEKLDTNEMARRVRVLAARVPEDGEVDRASRWFKRYIRPYLVASGTDYTITQATAPGGLGRTLINEIRARRLEEASKDASDGQSAPFSGSGMIMTALEDRDKVQEANELGGGLVVLGRGALKEYLWALRKGYGEEIDLREEARLQGLGLGVGDKRKDARVEREEEIVVRELEKEDALAEGKAPFDEPDPLETADYGPPDEEPTNVASGLKSIGFVPYRNIPPAPVATAPQESAPLLLSSRSIPPQPPLLLVPFSHAFGAQRWPAKLLHFFNHRSDVKLGAELAITILNNQTRPFDPPVRRNSLGELEGILDDNFVAEMRVGQHKDTPMVQGIPTGSRDVDFLFDTEEPTHFRRSYRSLPSALEYQRRNYLTVELPPRLQQARELRDGRTPTKAESNNPPKIESELRKERLEKEIRWRQQLQGWAVRRSGSGMAWDEAWGNTMGNEPVLKVFSEVTDAERADLDARRRLAEAEAARKQAELDALP